jgi:hypothetical protein
MAPRTTASSLLALCAALAVCCVPLPAAAIPCAVTCNQFPNSFCDNSTGSCSCTPRTCADLPVSVGVSPCGAVTDNCGTALDCNCAKVGVVVNCSSAPSGICTCRRLTCTQLESYGLCGTGLVSGCIGDNRTRTCACPPDDPDSEPESSDESSGGAFQNMGEGETAAVIVSAIIFVVALTTFTVIVSWARHRKRDAKRERDMWGGLDIPSNAPGSAYSASGMSREISAEDYYSALMESTEEEMEGDESSEVSGSASASGSDEDDDTSDDSGSF